MADDMIGAVVDLIGSSIRSNLQRKQDDANNFLVDLTGKGTKIKQASEDEEDLMTNPVGLPVDRIFANIGRLSSGGLGGSSGQGVNLGQLMQLFIK